MAFHDGPDSEYIKKWIAKSSNFKYYVEGGDSEQEVVVVD